MLHVLVVSCVVRTAAPHTFYELNEALPEEAQIAIREFPSKTAQTVGLLSRGETLEVTVRGGNWLKISGGSVDKAWIMWRTDAIELLQEASDVCSGNCVSIETRFDAAITNESLQEGVPGDNQTELASLRESADKIVGAAASDSNEEISVVSDDAATVTIDSAAVDQSNKEASKPSTTNTFDGADEEAERVFSSQDNEYGSMVDSTVSQETERPESSTDAQPLQPARTLLHESGGDATSDNRPVHVKKKDSNPLLSPPMDENPVGPEPNCPAGYITSEELQPEMDKADDSDGDTADAVEEAEPVRAAASWIARRGGHAGYAVVG
ncbi:unnamed protein product [Phytophthora fragariaefolia]|uniref:Unnamed protein product n=1 Tax=Phytophthora fragariaefolia TaxID=1490495 RepID=A0A9W7D5T8_9STRA|nr:unnamed protein product [Phytophthora fragariaefolia]